jgi:hypothetical protein
VPYLVNLNNLAVLALELLLHGEEVPEAAARHDGVGREDLHAVDGGVGVLGIGLGAAHDLVLMVCLRTAAVPRPVVSDTQYCVQRKRGARCCLHTERSACRRAAAASPPQHLRRATRRRRPPLRPRDASSGFGFRYGSQVRLSALWR